MANMLDLAKRLGGAMRWPRSSEAPAIDRLNGCFSDADLARVEAGKLAIENAPFHAGELVRAVASLARLRADEKGLALNAVVAPELEGWFEGDVTRVRQILTNLVSNAVKFTVEGAVTIEGFPTAEGRLRLTIIKTGVVRTPRSASPASAQASIASRWIDHPHETAAPAFGLTICQS